MKPRRVQQISEMPLLLDVHDCAQLLGVSYQGFYYRRKAGDWPKPFNRTGRPQWHREVIEAYLRHEHSAEAQVA